jgi:hypothetical protein
MLLLCRPDPHYAGSNPPASCCRTFLNSDHGGVAPDNGVAHGPLPVAPYAPPPPAPSTNNRNGNRNRNNGESKAVEQGGDAGGLSSTGGQTVGCYVQLPALATNPWTIGHAWFTCGRCHGAPMLLALPFSDPVQALHGSIAFHRPRRSPSSPTAAIGCALLRMAVG